MSLDRLELQILVLMAEFSDGVTLFSLSIANRSLHRRCAQSLQIQNVFLRRELERVSCQFRQQRFSEETASGDVARPLRVMMGRVPLTLPRLNHSRRPAETAASGCPSDDAQPASAQKALQRFATASLLLTFDALSGVQALAQSLFSTLSAPLHRAP